MNLSVYVPELQMLEFVAFAGKAEDRPSAEAISSPGINWEDPEKHRPGLSDVFILNNPANEPNINDSLKQLNLDADFSAIVMRLSLDGNYIGEVAVRTRGMNQYKEEHGRLFVFLREPIAIALANALKHMEVIRLNEILADDSRYYQQELSTKKGSEVVGENFGLSGVMGQVQQAAPLDNPILLLGETGCGKGDGLSAARAALCFWMKSANFPFSSRSNCCMSFRTGKLSGWAGPGPSPWTFVLLPPPNVTWLPWYVRESFVRICGTGSMFLL